jgi:chromosome partitioning protein
MVISVTNLKGGVGKTTISVNIAVGLALRDYSICLVDSDREQRSATEWRDNRTVVSPQITVVSVSEKQFTSEIKALRDKFDIVLIDGVPQLSELAQYTIGVSDLVIIPITPSLIDYRGFETFYKKYKEIKTMKEEMGGRVKGAVLINRVQRNRLVHEIPDAVQSYGITLLKSRLVDRLAYKDTFTEGLSVLEYKDEKAKEETRQLIEEIIALMSEDYT